MANKVEWHIDFASPDAVNVSLQYFDEQSELSSHLPNSKRQGAEEGEDCLVDGRRQECQPGQLAEVGGEKLVLQQRSPVSYNWRRGIVGSLQAHADRSHNQKLTCCLNIQSAKLHRGDIDS